jgi:hypothetical protein
MKADWAKNGPLGPRERAPTKPKKESQRGKETEEDKPKKEPRKGTKTQADIEEDKPKNEPQKGKASKADLEDEKPKKESQNEKETKVRGKGPHAVTARLLGQTERKENCPGKGADPASDPTAESLFGAYLGAFLQQGQLLQ